MPRSKQQAPSLGPQVVSELFKPARLEVYESLQVAGPASVAELAQRLGRPADSLYYHVRKLLSIGVVEERDRPAPEGGGRGRRGAVFGVVSRELQVRLDPGSRRSRQAWAEGGAAVLRLAQRDFERALESGDARPEGRRRNLMLRRVKVRLDAARRRELNARIDDLNALLREYAEDTEGELCAITCVMTPLEERNRP